MRVTQSGTNLTAVASGTHLVGLAIGAGPEAYGLSVGLEDRRKIMVYPDSSVAFEWPVLAWPEDEFFSVRISSNLPPSEIKE